MAKNLRAKLPSSDKLIIFDKNEAATSQFAKDNQGTEVATCVREVAEKSVRLSTSALSHTLCDEFFVLSMI